MRRAAVVMVAFSVAGCSGGGTSDPTTTTSQRSETTGESDPTTSDASTTMAPTTTVASDAIVPSWSSAGAFVTAIADASAGVADANPNAVALAAPESLSRSETDDPALGAFGWAVSEGVLVGGIDELEAGAPTEVVATLLVAGRSDSTATTAMAAYLAVYASTDALDKLSGLLQGGESGAQFTVTTTTVTVYGRLSGEMPEQQVIIAVFPTDRPELAELTVNAVTGLDT